MKNLLNALQEGRFVELPETNKEKAMNYLANLIEAMPDMRPGTDVAGAVMAREAQFNTGMGLGWACPHMRTQYEGDIICAAGWSPAGIDYGSSDGKPVHFLVMYYVPDSQKHVYLKEISSLVKVILKKQADRDISKIVTLGEARDYILDLVSTALESQISDAKARMIHLEAKSAAVHAAPEIAPAPFAALAHSIVPLSILVLPGTRPVILSQDADVVAKLEAAPELDANMLAKQSELVLGNYKILFRGQTGYQSKRVIYDCLAIKLNGAGAPAQTATQFLDKSKVGPGAA